MIRFTAHGGVGPDSYIPFRVWRPRNPTLVPKLYPYDVDVCKVVLRLIGANISFHSDLASTGTLRLFISPVSTFPTPATWHEVGHYDFPPVAASGTWVPTSANQCITLPATLIQTLGEGHYCFIGIIECDADPAPDRTLVNSVSELHDYIRKSNNYAWRNCNIVDIVIPAEPQELPVTIHHFYVTGFTPRTELRDLEIDARDTPKGTKIVMWMPKEKLNGLRAYDILSPISRIPVEKIAGVIKILPPTNIRMVPFPVAEIAEPVATVEMMPKAVKRGELRRLRPLEIKPEKITRLKGLHLTKNEKIKVHFAIQFPQNTGTRDVMLVFQERTQEDILGQMNFLFRIRKA
jgi:hypothetical protein